MNELKKKLGMNKFNYHVNVLYLDTIQEEMGENNEKILQEINTLAEIRAPKEKQKDDLQKAIDVKFLQFDEILTLKHTLEFNQTLNNENGSGDGLENCETKFMGVMTKKSEEIERKLFLNSNVREISRIKSKITFLETEQKKLDNKLDDLDMSEQTDMRSAFDHRNKIVVEIVTIWKERQQLAEQAKENEEKQHTLDGEVKELEKKLLELDDGPSQPEPSSYKAPLLNLTSFNPIQLEDNFKNLNPIPIADKIKSPLPYVKKTPPEKPKTPKAILKNDMKQNKNLNQVKSPSKIAKPITTAKKMTPPIKLTPSKKQKPVPDENFTRMTRLRRASTASQDAPPLPERFMSTPTNSIISVQASHRMGETDNEFENFGSTISSPHVLMSPGASEDMNTSFFGGNVPASETDAPDSWF